MPLKHILMIALIAVCLLLTLVIMAQKDRDAGFGALSGGLKGDTYWAQHKKQSLEGRLVTLTRLLGAAMLILSAVISMID